MRSAKLVLSHTGFDRVSRQIRAFSGTHFSPRLKAIFSGMVFVLHNRKDELPKIEISSSTSFEPSGETLVPSRRTATQIQELRQAIGCTPELSENEVADQLIELYDANHQDYREPLKRFIIKNQLAFNGALLGTDIPEGLYFSIMEQPDLKLEEKFGDFLRSKIDGLSPQQIRDQFDTVRADARAPGALNPKFVIIRLDQHLKRLFTDYTHAEIETIMTGYFARMVSESMEGP